MEKPIGVGLLVTMVLAVGLPANAQRYIITDLGTIQGSTYIWATGVNNLGHAVGVCWLLKLIYASFSLDPAKRHAGIALASVGRGRIRQRD